MTHMDQIWPILFIESQIQLPHVWKLWSKMTHVDKNWPIFFIESEIRLPNVWKVWAKKSHMDQIWPIFFIESEIRLPHVWKVWSKMTLMDQIRPILFIFRVQCLEECCHDNLIARFSPGYSQVVVKWLLRPTKRNMLPKLARATYL